MSQLPHGWIEATVRDVSLDINYGYTTSASMVANGPRFLRITDIQNGKVNWDSVPFCKTPPTNATRYSLKVGDIVFARTGATTGKSFLIRATPNAVFASYLIRLRPSEAILPEFLAYFFQSKSYWEQITANLSGSAQPNCNATKLASLSILLPPLNEQRRIVAKLEKLLRLVDAAQARLAAIPRILKRFRQSVLDAACSGMLTADWRQNNIPKQSAVDLIESLRTERPDPHFDTFEKSTVRQLPQTWAWAPLGGLGQTIGGGTPSKGDETFWNGSVPWVTPKDMKRDRISNSEDHITEVAMHNSSVKEVPPGAILFVVRGMILNHTLPVAITDSMVTLNQDMKALVPEVRRMSEYLFVAARHVAQAILFDVKEATHGTRRIETPLLKNWGIPIPPLPEQKEIVHRVEALFKNAESLEARYVIAKAQVDKLTQSILAKAFRGELSRQDPNDESASALQNRLRRGRSELTTSSVRIKVRPQRAITAKKSSERKKRSAAP